MEERFLDSGTHYDLLVDWEKRLKIEMKFLFDMIESIDTRIKSVLDVGCGTGRHAAKMAGNAYKITGIDLEESMIDEARKRIPSAEMIACDFLDDNCLIDRSFDMIYSLGNSVGLIAQSSGYQKIITKFSYLLRTGGLLVFQTLNFERERSGWSKPRQIFTGDGEYIFLRRFQTDEQHVHPEIVTLFRPVRGDTWEMSVRGPSDIPRITSADMEELLKEYGFSNIKLFGNYQQAPYDPEQSIDMIWVVQKTD